MKFLSNASTGQQPDWHATAPWIRFGTMAVGGLCIAIFVLSTVLSVSGAVIARGTVTVESRYQTVQHREGGIIKSILVSDGALVRKGQVLIELDGTKARADVAVTAGRIADLRVQRARLLAERDGAAKIALPPDIAAGAAQPDLAPIIASQSALFDARRASRHGERAMLDLQAAQLDDQLRAFAAQLAARRREAQLAARDFVAVRSLYDKGFANRQRKNRAERESARLTGDVGRLEAEVARVKAAGAEARLKLVQLEKTFTRSVVDELRKLRAALAELEQARRTANDTLERIRLRAPRTGYVHALQTNTLGGVIKPGAAVAQIIPAGERFLIEARVKPSDVDKVRVGLPTSLRFTAFNARRTPRLKGKVKGISPAQLTDDRGGDYFAVQVALEPLEIAKIGPGHKLVPGMPAEVFIETEPRSVMSYFLKPLLDAMTYSLREE